MVTLVYKAPSMWIQWKTAMLLLPCWYIYVLHSTCKLCYCWHIYVPHSTCELCYFWHIYVWHSTCEPCYCWHIYVPHSTCELCYCWHIYVPHCTSAILTSISVVIANICRICDHLHEIATCSESLFHLGYIAINLINDLAIISIVNIVILIIHDYCWLVVYILRLRLLRVD